nr:MAG: ORF1 [TTV-like mini virus]
MPYYYRRRNRRRPYRRRWFRPWRFRGYLRRRRRWRRQRWVRRKLSKIKIKQYQPETIHKSKIKGVQSLIIGNSKRLTNNYRQYEQSYIFHNEPGGGGFSITKYSLDGLYEQHQLVRNWWTKTNNNLPLCRYTGCKIKLYRSENVDYVCSFFTCYPMLATLHLYNSCQPSLQMMNPESIKVPSKRTKPLGKPYKILKLKPPAQLTNKWYFTADLAKTGLLLLTTSLASFDHYYISSTSENNNTGFKSLNTAFFIHHNFQQPGNEGYKPWTEGTQQKTLWAAPRWPQQQNQQQNYKVRDLIYLGNTSTNQIGSPIGDSPTTYFQNWKNWGNIFYHTYINEEETILVSTLPLDTIKNQAQSNSQIGTGFQTLTQPLLIDCRYSPDKDTGTDNQCYIVSAVRETTHWDPPQSDKIKHYGFPLWLLFYGWLDWLRKLNPVVHLEDHWTICFQSKYITPKLPYYVPIDYDFLQNKSPYQTEPGFISTEDNNNWNPHVKFQQQTLEKICFTGPGMPKLGNAKSVEVKCEYIFYFKYGGCPPKMETITDPTKLPVYPIPNNNDELYSFQNPKLPPESYLYHFDVSKDIIKDSAAKRIKRDFSSEKTLFQTTGRMQPGIQISPETTPEATDQETDSEKEEETLYQQLKQCKRKRKRLQLKLLTLMEK